MNIRYVFLVIFFMSIMQLKGQYKEDAIDYFHQCLLKSKIVEAKRQRISTKDLSAMRQATWQAWKVANKVYNKLTLPYLKALKESRTASWLLPDSLEPNATMHFYYGYKGQKPQEGYPLFIYLHGSGPKQKEWETGLALAQHFDDAPSVYFIPQIPNEGEWYRWWQRSKQYAWNTLLREAFLTDSINPNRFYVFGISEGGYGSQRLASFYADYWAAAGPMAGGEPLKNAPAENLSNIGFSLRTGADDSGFYRNKLTRYTANELDSLEQLSNGEYRHSVELIPNRQHFIDYSRTTPWLLCFTRNAHPKRFTWEDFEMDGQHRTGFYNLRVKKRPNDTLRTRYDVCIDNNEIDIIVENVDYKTTEREPLYGIELKFEKSYTQAENGELTLYLDENLVDLKQKVKVRLNGKEVYNKRVQLDVKNMQESLATFYDSQRIYPAAINIKY